MSLARQVSAACACAWLLLALVAPSAARAGRDALAEHAKASLWRGLGHAGERRAQDLFRQALAELRLANRQLPDWVSVCSRTLGPGFGGDSLPSLRGRARALRELSRQALRKRAHVEAALVRLQRATELDPESPEILYALAEALMHWEQPGPTWRCESQRRDDEALQTLQRLQREHPSFQADEIAFELAVLFARLQRFAEAGQAYAQSMTLSLDHGETSVALANLAEMTMLAGDLEGAVEHYGRALRVASSGRDYPLALWGRAVALDRLGEHDAAMQDAQKATETEGGHMLVLRSDGVFFEPPHEIDYYEGLGHEALAARPDADRAGELAAAAASFEAFIAAAGDSGPFTAAARASLERIQTARRALPARTAQTPKRRYRPRITADTLP
ncbi:MAG: tetratricopeptide repeat protein [Polyangiales bacterium]